MKIGARICLSLLVHNRDTLLCCTVHTDTAIEYHFAQGTTLASESRTSSVASKWAALSQVIRCSGDLNVFHAVVCQVIQLSIENQSCT